MAYPKINAQECNQHFETKSQEIRAGPVPSSHRSCNDICCLITFILIVIGDINILISSPGDDVAEGMDIGEMLEMYQSNVETTGIGVVAPIASVILMAGDKVKMSKNSFLMIHQPWGGVIGTADEMRNTADTLEKMDDILVNYYVDKIKKRNKAEGNTSLRVKRMMQAETWLTAQQAYDLGFIDE